eukprot:scaffold3570_cov227-Amphora_coffeaeformis.AAC.9
MGNEISTQEGEESTKTDFNETHMDGSGKEKEPSGWMVSVDQDYQVLPTTKICPLCANKKGNDGLNPLEAFVRYPCCCIHSDDLCKGCMWEHKGHCGECITNIPQGNKYAISWLLDRISKHLGPAMCHRGKLYHLLGRVFLYGSGTFLDELQRMPIYERMEPPNTLLAMMNPPNVQQGVNYLTMAADEGSIPAMLDLADAYSTTWNNDPFQKDKKKAEYWFQRASGRGNKIHPLAITRYGDFLKWEYRFNEACNMYKIAAVHGHARGQYEYAICLLEGIGANQDTTCEKDQQQLRHKCTNDDTTEAIEWLCKASENGFYIPSYLRLAGLLIQTVEKEYGTANLTGRSPLPRVLQILDLISDGIHGNSETVKKAAKELLERHNLKTKCAKCGTAGSENNPLVSCDSCGVVFYCSRVCMRKDFRDGHKYDCCSQDLLFDFHSIKLSLPWSGQNGQTVVSKKPSLRGPQSRTLMQMVEDDTDEVYGEQELDYDEHIMIQLMLRMRINLETYLDRILKQGVVGTSDELISTKNKEEKQTHSAGGDVRDLKLIKRIQAFSRYPGVDEKFVNVMHKIRALGNSAAHQSPDAAKLCHEECKNAVREYRQCKELYEICKSKTVQGSSSALEASGCDQSKEYSQSQSNLSTLQQPQQQSKKKKKRAKKKNSKNTGKV